jgi:hypothetical protein
MNGINGGREGERTDGINHVIPHTKNNLLATCIAVVGRGDPTHPSNTCPTSKMAALCTNAVRGPRDAYVV